jgi:hypothetical protein
MIRSEKLEGARNKTTSRPEEYAAYVRSEDVRWGKIIRESGLAAR